MTDEQLAAAAPLLRPASLWTRGQVLARPSPVPGNAAGSTLRLTLGCLLASELGVELRRVGSGRRLTFANGEGVLSAWMGRHARVCWMPHARPWELEQVLVARLDVPLNLHGNSQHPFYPKLRSVRAAAKATARALPVWTPAASRPAGDRTRTTSSG